MERYYDLVLANAMNEEGVKEAKNLPGIAPVGASEQKRWEIAKKAFYGSKIGLISEWGLIDFDPLEKEKMQGGEKLSYDEFLEIQKDSGDCIRQYFQECYHDCISTTFKGRIQSMNKKTGKVCFERIFINGMYTNGDILSSKEDHVWMEMKNLDQYHVGDCLSFEAEIYRYLKTKYRKMIDFGIRNPQQIDKIDEYELPSDEELKLQEVDKIICNVMCMFREHCYGTCIANQAWREDLRKKFLSEMKER